jgi:hypothetical protein
MVELSAECPECRLAVGRAHCRVIATTAIFHRECYEAWYFARKGRPARLRRRPGEPRVFEERRATAPWRHTDGQPPAEDQSRVPPSTTMATLK